MLKTQQAVHDMMKALELPLPNEEVPGLEKINFNLFKELVREEAQEFQDAMESLEAVYFSDSCNEEDVLGAWAEVLDAVCDTIVVLHNTTNAMGIDLEPFFDEVHKTNMAKVGGKIRADGKKLKPEGWTPPQLIKILKKELEKNATTISSVSSSRGEVK